jgi:hypothetical protein
LGGTEWPLGISLKPQAQLLSRSALDQGKRWFPRGCPAGPKRLDDGSKNVSLSRANVPIRHLVERPNKDVRRIGRQRAAQTDAKAGDNHCKIHKFSPSAHILRAALNAFPRTAKIIFRRLC